MPLDNPQGGLSYAAEFQSSALPWATSSIAPSKGTPVRFDFPMVTRLICVSNLSTTTGSLSFGFTRAGVVSTNHKFIVNPNQTISLELRVKQLWLQGEGSDMPAFNLLAGLTTIQSRQYPQLSGTLDDGTIGWTGVG